MYTFLGLMTSATKAGADRNTCNCRGETPLWQAARRGHAEVVRVLLRAGLDVNRGDVAGETPLGIACRSGREEILGASLRMSPFFVLLAN